MGDGIFEGRDEPVKFRRGKSPDGTCRDVDLRAYPFPERPDDDAPRGEWKAYARNYQRAVLDRARAVINAFRVIEDFNITVGG